MRAPLLVVTGTATNIGKTLVAATLVSEWARRGIQVAGIKPVESGAPLGGGDVSTLGQASTFHVTRFRPPYLLTDPVSPHLAARRDGVTIDLDHVHDWISNIRSEADAVVLELAGGLFTPLTTERTNADLLRALAPTKTVLVAPDRLGVLHDVLATTLAARALGLTLDGVVLSAPSDPDDSTGTNAAELALMPAAPRVLATLPRATGEVIAKALGGVIDALAL